MFLTCYEMALDFLTRLVIQLKSTGILMKQLSAKNYCIYEEPSSEKKTSLTDGEAQTKTVARIICPKGHAALSRS
jgi:hypothetical protein